MTLTDFLVTRVAEDEAMAREEEAALAREFGTTDAQTFSPAHDVDPTCTWYGDGDHEVVRSDECRTLRYLAAVFSDHADYDEAWRP